MKIMIRHVRQLYSSYIAEGKRKQISTIPEGFPTLLKMRIEKASRNRWIKLTWPHWVQKGMLLSSSTISLFFGMSYALLAKRDISGFEVHQHRNISKCTECDKKILIPTQRKEKEGWKTLVLDMDEMLVGNATEIQHRKNITDKLVHFRDRSFAHIHRPHLKEFLEYATANFEVILWTAGTKEYAQECVRNILIVHSLPCYTFDYIIARDPSWFEITPTSWYKKDLHQLGRSTDNVLMFENSPVVFPSRNAIVVAEFLHSTVFDNYSQNRESEFADSNGPLKSWLKAVLPEPCHEIFFNQYPKSPVVPCSSLTPDEDATLQTGKEIIQRWKLSPRKVHDFLKQEIEMGVLYRARIKPYGSPRAETIATLPLHRATS